MRIRRLSEIQNADRTALKLAATASLAKRVLSPLSKLRETRGLVTLKRCPDNNDVKISHAHHEYPLADFKYQPAKEYEFRTVNPD